MKASKCSSLCISLTHMMPLGRSFLASSDDCQNTVDHCSQCFEEADVGVDM